MTLQSKSSLTFDNKLFVQVCATAVDFWDDCSDTAAPEFFMFMYLSGWDLRGEEWQHSPGEFRLLQQEVQRPPAPVFTLRLLDSTETLV